MTLKLHPERIIVFTPVSKIRLSLQDINLSVPSYFFVDPSRSLNNMDSCPMFLGLMTFLLDFSSDLESPDRVLRPKIGYPLPV